MTSNESATFALEFPPEFPQTQDGRRRTGRESSQESGGQIVGVTMSGPLEGTCSSVAGPSPFTPSPLY